MQDCTLSLYMRYLLLPTLLALFLEVTKCTYLHVYRQSLDFSIDVLFVLTVFYLGRNRIYQRRCCHWAVTCSDGLLRNSSWGAVKHAKAGLQ